MFARTSLTIDEVTTSPVARVAVVSLHTSPFDQPGAGSSGGMNVEIRALSERLDARDVAVDIFTRCAGREVPEVERVGPLTRVIQVQAGPCAELPGAELTGVAGSFTEGLLRRGAELGSYDLVHSHYWLSGEAASGAARRWGIPLVASFHTLAEVKNLALADGEAPEPLARVAGERRTIHAADRVLVATRDDAHHLIDLYSADPLKIRIVPPGVDGRRFRPRDSDEARKRLGLGPGPLALFVGRLQRLKGPDLAIEAFSEALRGEPGLMRDARLLLVGGPSGPEAGSIRQWLEALVASHGLRDRVTFVPPQPHDQLARYYSAADVLLMPSRSESFGIAALEAQASGTPVVAAEVGGLRQAVRDGGGGFLITGREPAAYAEAIVRIVASPDLARRLARSGVSHAAAFSWERTVDGLLAAYGELVPGLESAQAS